MKILNVKIDIVLLIIVASLIIGKPPNRPIDIYAQESASVLYIPLIGITAVPVPLALPEGEGNVTYNYAVKNFLQELALNDIKVADDSCTPVIFVTGDDNSNSKLDYNETWRYSCTTKLFETTQSTATATGIANDITAAHRAYSTVIVGSDNSPPLVSIVNITKVAYPLSLPAEGGQITFTYKVNNPGVVPLSNVTIRDNKCAAMSGKLGDRNGNFLLDTNEVWIYTCKMNLTETTTNTVNVSAFANGLQAHADATITVRVDTPTVKFPNVGENSSLKPDFKVTVWKILLCILVILTTFFIFIRKNKLRKKKWRKYEK